jgi:pimeloyl-ACP methyl ester carboxylesterase
MEVIMRKWALMACLCAILVLLSSASFAKGDNNPVLRIDHYVPHVSTVPAIQGEEVQLYVREKVLAGVAKTFSSIKKTGKVVLMVHGATVPSALAYDFPAEGYSWMEYLAKAGFDTFALELTGYGFSPRPWPMDDFCNLDAANQSYRLTSADSDWDDINAAVEYIKMIRGVDKVSLIGWSQGGPRAGGYAVKYPEKVDKLILLAPLGTIPKPAGDPPYSGPAFTITTYDSPWGLNNRWGAEEACPGQRDQAIYDMFLDAWLETDPEGATWGPGMGRAASGAAYWDASGVQAPTLIMVGLKDGLRFMGQSVFNEVSNDNKVFMTIDCTTHYAIFERSHEYLFKASKDWLLHQSIMGINNGTLNVDFDGTYTKNPENPFE